MNSRLETKSYSGSSSQKHRFKMVRNWIEILLTNGPDEPIAEAFYILYLSDDQRIEGKLDANGKLRKENLPPGEILVEFPEFFDVVVIEDDAIVEGEGCWTPPATDFSARIIEKAPASHSSGGPSASDTEVEDDYNYLDEEDDLEDDDLDDEDLEEDEDWEEDEGLKEDEEEDLFDASMLDEMSDPDDLEDEEFIVERDEYLPNPKEDSTLKREEFSVATVSCATGHSYHLAIIHCIPVHVFQADGRFLEQQVDYQVKDEDGSFVAEGKSEDGIIFVDMVGIGDYEIIIADTSHWISSKRDASDFECIHLPESPSSKSGEDYAAGNE